VVKTKGVNKLFVIIQTPHRVGTQIIFVAFFSTNMQSLTGRNINRYKMIFRRSKTCGYENIAFQARGKKNSIDYITWILIYLCEFQNLLCVFRANKREGNFNRMRIV
jgi:hypothetical protein